MAHWNRSDQLLFMTYVDLYQLWMRMTADGGDDSDDAEAINAVLIRIEESRPQISGKYQDIIDRREHAG